VTEFVLDTNKNLAAKTAFAGAVLDSADKLFGALVEVGNYGPLRESVRRHPAST
jgi:hypothetical protein